MGFTDAGNGPMYWRSSNAALIGRYRFNELSPLCRADGMDPIRKWRRKPFAFICSERDYFKWRDCQRETRFPETASSGPEKWRCRPQTDGFD